MFEYLRGIITDITPSYLVLEVNGLGFLLHMANPYRLTNKMNEETTLYVYHDIRQDTQLLYGFRTATEKALFLKLIKVSGIGPKSATAILANEDHKGLITAIENDDVGFLTQFPGVGKKTAGQLVLDLKGKLDGFLTEADLTSSHAVQASSSQNVQLEEAIEALLSLGYSKRECEKVRQTLAETEAHTTEAYLREGLSLLTSKA